MRHQAGGPGSLMRSAERDESVHTLISAEPLHVVTGDDSAERVTDEVDAVVTGRLAQHLHAATQLVCRLGDVVRDNLIVDRHDPLEATAAKDAAKNDEA